jgi:hypothetical protein
VERGPITDRDPPKKPELGVVDQGCRLERLAPASLGPASRRQDSAARHRAGERAPRRPCRRFVRWLETTSVTSFIGHAHRRVRCPPGRSQRMSSPLPLRFPVRTFRFRFATSLQRDGPPEKSAPNAPSCPDQGRSDADELSVAHLRYRLEDRPDHECAITPPRDPIDAPPSVSTEAWIWVRPSAWGFDPINGD